ncbi:MAG: hypothetical protein ABSH39_19530 [Candidatus Acidiferrum sp.]|jgi:hypothetical protein
MRRIHKLFGSTATLGFFLAGMTLTGCRDRHHGDRVFDREHNDYHAWNDREASAYARWEAETRRSHVEFTDRPPADQSSYWAWRHSHPE